MSKRAKMLRTDFVTIRSTGAILVQGLVQQRRELARRHCAFLFGRYYIYRGFNGSWSFWRRDRHTKHGTILVDWMFEPRDLWIGVYVERKRESAIFYVCLVPCLPFRIAVPVSWGRGK